MNTHNPMETIVENLLQKYLVTDRVDDARLLSKYIISEMRRKSVRENRLRLEYKKLIDSKLASIPKNFNIQGVWGVPG